MTTHSRGHDGQRDFLTSWRTHQSTLQSDLSTSESTLVGSSNTAASGYAAGTAGADNAFVGSTGAALTTYRVGLTTHRGTYNIALETAAATQAESEAFARGAYAVALADHSLLDFLPLRSIQSIHPENTSMTKFIPG